MTSIYGMTEAGLKKTGRDARVLPKTVIYDPELTLSLPTAISITSGINAVAHAVEALYACDRNPITEMMAEEGIRTIAKALPVIKQSPRDVDARHNALYGAWLCGTVLGNTGMALHHKLCHTLGGAFNLPHAELHTVILAQVVSFNAADVPDAMRRIKRALEGYETSSAAAALFDLAKENGASVALKDIGSITEADLARAADLAVQTPYWNPRPVGPTQRNDIYQLFLRAYYGERPH